MANTSPSQAKDQLCYYYQHRFLPVPFGLAAAESASCSSLWLWFYCFAADRRAVEPKNTHRRFAMTIFAVNLVALGVLVLACSGIFFSTLGQPVNFAGMHYGTIERPVILPVVGALALVSAANCGSQAGCLSSVEAGARLRSIRMKNEQAANSQSYTRPTRTLLSSRWR